MTELVILNKQSQSIQKLSYYDGENVIKVDEQYYLIAQCDSGKIILFTIEDGMQWNRKLDPVTIDKWANLTTDTIKDYFPEFIGKVVTRVNAKITIEIND